MAGFDKHDLYALIGTGLVIAGLWKIYPPLALIAFGLIFLKLATAKGAG